MTMWGANVGELRAAAQELRVAADQLDASQGKLTGDLGGLQWLGNVAVRFSDLWNSGLKPRMAVTSGFLRDNAD